MTITRTNFSAAVTAGTTSINTGDPVGGANGDLLLLFAANKYALPNVPSGWPLVVQQSGGQGAAGVDSGTVNASCYGRIQDGTEGSATALTVTGGNSLLGYQVLFTSDLVQAGTHAWGIAVCKGADNTAGTSWSVTGDVDPDIRAGDYVIAFSAINGNGPGSGWWSAESLTCSGVTFVNNILVGDAFTSNGDDIALRHNEWNATAGVSNAPPVYTMTASTTAGNQPAGATIFVRLREVPLVSEAVGTAAGTSAASGAGSSIAESVGTAAGTSTASATGFALVPEVEIEEAVVIRVPGGDFALRWIGGAMDMALDGDDVAADDGLRTAVLMSLFTDRRAEDDDPTPAEDREGEGDRRGWWADEFNQVDGDRMGARLWLLDRSKRTEDVPRRAEELVREALAWMLEDRVTNRIDVVAMASDAALLMTVTLYRPQGDPVTFRFKHVWDGELLPDAEPGAVAGHLLFTWNADEGWDEGALSNP